MKQIKKLVVLLLCFSIAKTASSQLASEDSVKLLIGQLYTAMRNSDGTIFQRCFLDSAKIQTISRDKNGATVIKTDKVADFAQVISKIPKGAADQQISFDVVRVSGSLAIAWTPYKFYANGKLYYCGVNAIQLVRVLGLWRVWSMIDTRSKDNCSN